MEAALLIDRVLRLKQQLEEICKDPERLQDLSPGAREWLKQYPKVNSRELALFWGGLLGYEDVFLKYRFWIGATPAGIGTKIHYWLCVPEILDEKRRIVADMLELDMAYDNFGESNTSKMLFLPGLHPFESGRSVTLRQDQEISHMVVPVLQREIRPFPHRNGDGTQTVWEEICQYMVKEESREVKANRKRDA